jgi:hypothetical protein
MAGSITVFTRTVFVATVLACGVGLTVACDTDSRSTDRSVSAIRIEHIHNLDKVQLKGSAALYSGWTIDDTVEITMLYSDSEKPCAIDVSKPAVLVKYRVTAADGNVAFGWQLQPNLNDAGCLLKFASFRTGKEEEGHSE